MNPAQLPSILKKVGDKTNGDFTAFVDNAFAKSIFVDENKVNAWLDNPKSLAKDPIFALMYNILETYWDLSEQAETVNDKRAERLYMQGLMEMQQDRNFYPDANFTMRLTYGSVQDCEPRDAVTYSYITTNDITGGNSGSPVIDANGNLIGLAFDGNWEAMSGDISFENQVQRTICMDMRYLLFIIDKMANAQNLMKELTIVE